MSAARPSLRRVMDDMGAELRTRLGADFLFTDAWDENTRPPFMAWAPDVANTLPPGEIGSGPARPSQIMRREWLIKVRAWGDSLDDVEHIVDTFLAAAHDLWTAYSYRPGGPELWNFGGVTNAGAKCEFTFHLVTPVLRTQPATRRILRLDPVLSMDGEEVDS